MHEAKRDLLTPDEVMRLGAERQLLLRPGGHPVVARKTRYYEEKEFGARVI